MEVRSLDWEDHLEEGMQPILVFLPGEPWTEEPGGLQFGPGVATSWTRLKQLSTHGCGSREFQLQKVDMHV